MRKISSRLFLLFSSAGTVFDFVGRWMIPGAFTALPLKQFISGAHDECNIDCAGKAPKWLKLCEFQQTHNYCYLFKLCTSAVRGNFKSSVQRVAQSWSVSSLCWNLRQFVWEGKILPHKADRTKISGKTNNQNSPRKEKMPRATCRLSPTV